MRVLIVVGAVILTFVAAESSGATTGTMSVTADTVLTEDHHGSVEIAADGVTLDCAGHRITGVGVEPKPTRGVVVEGRAGVTVRNCTVDGFAGGFRIEATTQSEFVANTVDAVGHGFFVTDAHDNTFVGNRVTGALDGEAFWLSGSTENTIAANVAESSRVGFFLLGEQTSQNTLTNNTTRGGDGYVLSSASQNRLSTNTAYRSDFSLIGGAHDNVLAENRAVDGGFNLDMSYDNDLVDNASYRGGFWENNPWIEGEIDPQRIVNRYSNNLCLGHREGFAPPFPEGLCARGLAGGDRFATAARLSASAFDPGAQVVYVATGADFPDALSAGPVAAIDRAPILLVHSDAVPGATATELLRLRPDRIVVLGGTRTISEAVAAELASYTAGPVDRVAGADRFATAAAISRSRFPAGTDMVCVATGEDFPDALAAGPRAAASNCPVLLVNRDAIPGPTSEELDRLDPLFFDIFGGPTVISADVERQLGERTSGTVSRIAGANRFETAARISAEVFPRGVDAVYIVSGTNWPDALVAGAVAGAEGGPILLVTRDTIPEPTANELARLAPQNIIVVGGTKVISSALEDELAAYVR